MVIEMRDRAYAQRLAQRLCELCSGLEIEICRKGEFCEWNDTADGYHLYGGCDILLSDSERACYGLPEHTAFLKLRRQEIFLPAPRILELIAMAYEKKTGRGFLLKSESDAQILSFCAEQGGAGVTAICVTTARLLAGMQEGAVLYLQLLPPDAAWESACLDWKLYTKISPPRRDLQTAALSCERQLRSALFESASRKAAFGSLACLQRRFLVDFGGLWQRSAYARE